jgi:hypothetical protein
MRRWRLSYILLTHDLQVSNMVWLVYCFIMNVFSEEVRDVSERTS